MSAVGAPRPTRERRTLAERFRDFFEFAPCRYCGTDAAAWRISHSPERAGCRIDVAVRYQNVRPAIEIVIKEKHPNPRVSRKHGQFPERGASSTKILSFVVIEREHLFEKFVIRRLESRSDRVGGITPMPARATPSSLKAIPQRRLFGKCAVAIVAIEFVWLGII